MKCDKCERYKRKGHNYCKMCGEDLLPGRVKRVKLAIVDHVNEKFCGYCGGKLPKCGC